MWFIVLGTSVNSGRYHEADSCAGPRRSRGGRPPVLGDDTASLREIDRVLPLDVHASKLSAAEAVEPSVDRHDADQLAALVDHRQTATGLIERQVARHGRIRLRVDDRSVRRVVHGRGGRIDVLGDRRGTIDPT